jgi:hypothetical protein
LILIIIFAKINKNNMIPSGTRFIGFAESVDLTERRSASVNAETAVYTMDDIKGYKVYTALLTQSGGDDVQSISSGLLTIGVTYQIISEGANDDFTNVGAPNNNVGTYFVATGTTPNYFDGGELEYNAGAPVATVLENTIGDVWFRFSGVGSYRAESSGAFTIDKTTVSTSPKGYVDSPEDLYSWDISWTNSSNEAIIILSYFNGEPADDVINYGGAAMIEIRVYN